VTSTISLIVAASENGVIGKDGALPWRLPDDMKRFKRITMGHPCIMGRKTWDSLPRKPLPGRTNIVVTQNPNFAAPGARVAHSFDEALAIAREEVPSEIMVIGGEAIYAAALPSARRIHLTEVSGTFDGNAFFTPPRDGGWRTVEVIGPLEDGPLIYRYITLEKS
jgi:dihydrofolate reductase